jgi:Flp pilus assembly protein TadD
MPGNQDLSESLQQVLAGAPLDQVVPVGPQEIQALAVAGHQFLEQGQWEMCRNVFTALTTLAPSAYQGFAGLGALELKQSKTKDAFMALRKAVELKASDPAVYANLGEVILRMGKPKEAAALLGGAIALDPNKRHPAANRARAMLAGIEETRVSTKTEAGSQEPE